MLWHAYLAPTGCFPDWTDQQLPPPRSLKCWKMMLSVVFSSALLITCVLHTWVQLKGEGHENSRNTTDYENAKD